MGRKKTSVLEDTEDVNEVVDKESEVKEEESSVLEAKDSETLEEPVKVSGKKKKKKNSNDPEYNQMLLEAKVMKQNREDVKTDIKIKNKRKSQEVSIERIDTQVDTGLNNDQVNDRILKGYVNQKPASNTKSVKKIIFTNVITFFNILTLSIAAWLMSVNAWKDLTFLVVVTLNIVIGIIQEIRAKMTIDKLSLISAPTASVIRNSNHMEVDVTDLVLDDIIILDTGKQIASDSIIVEGSIEVNESLLTGESDAIIKRPGDLLYSGSFVVSGKCHARVDAVGKDNYIEQLTIQAKKYNKPKSELLASLNLIIKFMAIIIIPIGVLLFCMQSDQLLGNSSYTDSVRQTAGAMIGMIPSGLYLLTSIALAVGVMKLAQNKVLVQELYCIEMLARVDCLCLDKTGTITDGTMAVQNVVEYQGISGLSTKNIISAMLNATNDSNMTSVALEQKFGKAKRFKTLDIIPFSSQRKYSAATFEKYGTFLMGAPEFIMTKNYNQIASDVVAGANQGYRVLLIAHTDDVIKDDKINHDNLTPVALILIEDTVRPDAIETINYFKKSGVEVKVISGDNPITVSKVSERAGIENANEFISLDGLSDLEVVRAATKYTVFGRVSPAQKKLLVTTLKEAGKTVAMTGDGVNDILALKEADCSIAVASGSEAARNVSHLVLLDSNFSSMPKVVAEGRRVINNVAKVSRLFLTKTIFSLLLALYAISKGGEYPISTNQLIMIDLFCIGIPSFVLVLEPCNVKSTGKFLANIIKGALPGAIVILINSMIVLALSELLYLSKTDTSTLIVIIATFTCLIVLFETCKPFTLYKKFMYSFLLVGCAFVILLLPRFLDISPINSLGVYYDSSLEVESLTSTPYVEISKEGYLVIDGEYSNYQTTQTSHTLRNVDGYLYIDGVETIYEISPKISTNLTYDSTTGRYFMSTGLEYVYVLGGVETNIEYSDYLDLTITNVGDVYVNGISTKYNCLPTVKIDKSGYFVVNSVTTSIPAFVSTVDEVTIRNMAIYVNGREIGMQIDPITIGTNSENFLCVGGTKTDRLIDDNSTTFSVSNDMKYIIDDVTTDYNYNVNIETSSADMYVINNEYTSFKVTGDRNKFSFTYNEDKFLIINDTLTDYIVEVQTTIGGETPVLSLPAILLTIMLCALTKPLINLLKGSVPWARRQLENIQKLLGKM